jgi:hypothetical protein
MSFGVGVSGTATDTFNTGTATVSGLTTQASNSDIYIGVIYNTGRTPTVNTDSKGNTYTQVGSPLSFFSATFEMRLYKKEAAAGGSGHNFSVTLDVAEFLTIFVLEITGATGGEDTAVRASGTDGATPFTLTSGTPSQASWIAIALLGWNTADVTGLAESSGFTIQQSHLTGSSDAPGAIATRVMSSASAVSPSFTGTGMTDTGIRIVGVKDAGGAAAQLGRPWQAQGGMGVQISM